MINIAGEDCVLVDGRLEWQIRTFKIQNRPFFLTRRECGAAMDRTVTQVALLALEDCYITSLGGMSAVMLLANKLNRAQDSFAWQVLSLSGGAVRAGTH